MGEKPRWAGWRPEEGPGRPNKTLMVLQTHHISWHLEEGEAELVLVQVWLKLSFANMHGGCCLIGACARPPKEVWISGPPYSPLAAVPPPRENTNGETCREPLPHRVPTRLPLPFQLKSGLSWLV